MHTDTLQCGWSCTVLWPSCSLWLAGVHGCHISCQYLETAMSQRRLSRDVFTHEITVSSGKNWLDDKEENIYGLTVLQEALRAQLWYQMDPQPWLNVATWDQCNTSEQNTHSDSRVVFMGLWYVHTLRMKTYAKPHEHLERLDDAMSVIACTLS